jgi:hypothetical protein
VAAALGHARILCQGALGAVGLIPSRVDLGWGAQREGGAYLGFGEDLAAADTVLLCACLLEQLLGFGVVVDGLLIMASGCRGDR